MGEENLDRLNKEQTMFRSGLIFVPFLLLLILIGWLLLSTHVDSGKFGEAALEEPFISWVTSIKIVYLSVSFGLLLFLFLILYYGYGHFILLTPFLIAVLSGLFGSTFFISFIIALIKIESGGYALLFALSSFILLIVYLYRYISKRKEHVGKDLISFLWLLGFFTFLSLAFADSTIGKYTIIIRNEVQGSFFTKFILLAECMMGWLFIAGSCFMFIRAIQNLRALDFQFYHKMGIWRFKNKRRLEDPLKLVLSQTYSWVYVDDEGNQVKIPPE